MRKFQYSIVSIAACVSLLVCARSWAHEHDDSDHDEGNWRDCDHHDRRDHNRFHGTINLDQGLVLTPTTNAPARAKGKAEFLVVNDNGTNYEMLFVKTSGLTNGPYTVDVTDDTGENTYSLGTLNVVTKTNLDAGWIHHGKCYPWGNGTNAPSPGWTAWVHDCARRHPGYGNMMHLSRCTNLVTFATNAYCNFTNTLTIGSGSFLLPDGLSYSNAALVTVSDADNNVYLQGDFTATTNSTIIYKEIADIVPGSETNAQGSATIAYRLVREKAVGTFRLQASGLGSNEKLFLTADGTNTVKVFTKKAGTLDVRSFRCLNLDTVQDIVATDVSSNVVFTVHF